ncbi:hypothetical protein TIFTF001_034566 [Ficus carica]|uniref:Uncharacterized protein n=1 Tax=Ficus carica TaxID=3494 RepID=A0AA88JAR2_FICCA|nr:hypothetical protein TIFTF001_034566 [Ficus carica]
MGVYYWLFSVSSNKEMMITFHMCKEEFHRTSLPGRHESVGFSISTSLQTWNDLLAMFYHSTCSCTMGSIEMWVISDSTDGPTSSHSRSWTKHLIFGPLEGIACPLAFWRRDEFLMRRAKDEGSNGRNRDPLPIRGKNLGMVMTSQSTMEGLIDKSLVNATENPNKFE